MAQAAYAQANVELASQGRRLAGFILDSLLFFLTLIIGWIVWFVIAARNGQSPAKQLLGMRVIRGDGGAAGLGWMLIRDVVIRMVAFGAVDRILVAFVGESAGVITFALFAAAAIWCVWDANRQCLWDKAVGTRVIRTGGEGASGGGGQPGSGGAIEAAENLETLRDLHARGLLTDEEYEERRAREMERL